LPWEVPAEASGAALGEGTSTAPSECRPKNAVQQPQHAAGGTAGSGSSRSNDSASPDDSGVGGDSDVIELVRAAAGTTWALRAPSFTESDTAAVQSYIIAQMAALRTVIGDDANRAVNHQGLHMAQAIRDLGGWMNACFFAVVIEHLRSLLNLYTLHQLVKHCMYANARRC
jgi:hypothetical protein